MINVDVYVPIVNKTYDFSVNEHAQILYVIEEISEIIAQKEGCTTIKNPEHFVLCVSNNQAVLNPSKTLCEYSIGNGVKLMLI